MPASTSNNERIPFPEGMQRDLSSSVTVSKITLPERVTFNFTSKSKSPLLHNGLNHVFSRHSSFPGKRFQTLESSSFSEKLTATLSVSLITPVSTNRMKPFFSSELI